ncbi:pyroglutamyl-peptidase I [Alkalihalobacillus sp. MEB130]|uniref:pyroglutamyl-peptidase I n=1 Tax=Alkalihalobacillus sp. MEB130 TaxID=2976704 RepID=UPI0028E03FB2|nr:pyroglutamyl-peptidase I [Alkalihalobacillus sp. MEB130]MDT8858801.1 pyroglutamyl-peptidase I [Alkalihalobacillus sp. MEB130]
MRVLLTGFEPFLGHYINPTEEIVKELDGQQINNKQIIGRILPVAFSQSATQLIAHFEEEKPDAVIMLGLAAGRNRITPERVAINCSDGDKDNEGRALQDAVIQEDGPAAYFSTLPIRKIVNILNEASIPARISNTAGTYLCNNIMYEMLHYLEQHNLSCPAGFIHIPASHELATTNAQLPSMSHAELQRAVELIVSAV